MRCRGSYLCGGVCREQAARARGEKEKKIKVLINSRRGEDKAQRGHVDFDQKREALWAFLTRGAPCGWEFRWSGSLLLTFPCPGPASCCPALPRSRAGYLPVVTEPSPQPALRSACQSEMAQPSPRGAQSRCDPKGVLRSACWVGTPCWNFSSSVFAIAEAGLGKGLCGSDRDPG